MTSPAFRQALFVAGRCRLERDLHEPSKFPANWAAAAPLASDYVTGRAPRCACLGRFIARRGFAGPGFQRNRQLREARVNSCRPRCSLSSRAQFDDLLQQLCRPAGRWNEFSFVHRGHPSSYRARPRRSPGASLGRLAAPTECRWRELCNAPRSPVSLAMSDSDRRIAIARPARNASRAIRAGRASASNLLPGRALRPMRKFRDKSRACDGSRSPAATPISKMATFPPPPPRIQVNGTRLELPPESIGRSRAQLAAPLAATCSLMSPGRLIVHGHGAGANQTG